MRYKKAALILGGIVALTLFAAWSLSVLMKGRHLAYMQRISGVRLPSGVRQVSVYDNGEMYVTGHVLLPANALSDFARKYDFRQVPRKEEALLGLRGLEGLSPAYRTIPKDAEFAKYDGRSPRNTWLFILDKHSGHLWFMVQYPDYGGDPP